MPLIRPSAPGPSFRAQRMGSAQRTHRYFFFFFFLSFFTVSISLIFLFYLSCISFPLPTILVFVSSQIAHPSATSYIHTRCNTSLGQSYLSLWSIHFHYHPSFSPKFYLISYPSFPSPRHHFISCHRTILYNNNYPNNFFFFFFLKKTTT